MTITDPVTVFVHEPDLVTVSINTDQLDLLATICDVIRDDDDTDNPCIPFADLLYTEIQAATTT